MASPWVYPAKQNSRSSVSHRASQRGEVRLTVHASRSHRSVKAGLRVTRTTGGHVYAGNGSELDVIRELPLNSASSLRTKRRRVIVHVDQH